jgi:hypothetical protein
MNEVKCTKPFPSISVPRTKLSAYLAPPFVTKFVTDDNQLLKREYGEMLQDKAEDGYDVTVQAPIL